MTQKSIYNAPNAWVIQAHSASTVLTQNIWNVGLFILWATAWNVQFSREQVLWTKYVQFSQNEFANITWSDKLLFSSSISHWTESEILGFIIQDRELSATHWNMFAIAKLLIFVLVCERLQIKACTSAA